jgi:oxygen-independent coproporphyrinogen-3 oxidase
MNSNSIPLSLYIHMPWCVKKCPYCDFNSHNKPDVLPEQAYIAALLEDLSQDLTYAQNREISSIFIGGGTPSLFSAQALETLVSGIHKQLKLAHDCEITLEANPGTIERGQFSAYRALGINRISLGVQSFNAKHLKRLGRIHSNEEAIKAVEEIHQAGFKTFNIDLMHGLPDQSIDEGLCDLEQAIALKPTHISWYQLTIEPNTLFYAKPPTLPDENVLEGIEGHGESILAAAGFQHYETSAFAQPNWQCRHNINYWQFGDYLAIGAGAHGKITQANGEIIRYYKHKHPKAYLNKDQAYTAETKLISKAELPLEFMLSCMRLKQGFSIRQFEARTGVAIAEIQYELSLARDKGLLEIKDNQIVTTEKGARYLNEILALF